MKKLVFALFLAAFFLIRPFFLQWTGGWYPNDDYDYFAQASSISFGQFPSYKKEFFTTLEEGPLGAIGSGILATPFVSAFSLIDRFENLSIVERRTAQNVPRSWSQFGFVFSSVFYLCAGCFLLFRAASLLTGPAYASWAVILMVICQGIPLFAFRRPIFSHIPEFFLQSLLVYLLIRNELSGGTFIRRWWSWALLGIAAAMVFLVRNNNLLFAVVWPLLFLTRRPEGTGRRQAVAGYCWVILSFAFMIAAFKFLPEAYNHYTPYSNPFMYMHFNAPWQDILGQVIHVLIGIDWGLVFTAPLFLVAAGGLFFLKMPFKRKLIWAMAPLVVNFITIVFFGSQGGWYGYRYFIASALPLGVIPLAFLLKWIDGKALGGLKWVLGLVVLLPLLSMWFFDEFVMAWAVVPQAFGISDWGCLTYQADVWRSVVDPGRAFLAVYAGGFEYLHHLFFTVYNHFSNAVDGHMFDLLPEKKRAFMLAVPFDIRVFIRVMLIWSLPLCVGWFFRERKPVVKDRR